MPATAYKIYAWGTPVGQGYTGAVHVGVAGIAKKATSNDPLIVVNEVVCTSLARALLLPCPPGATLEKAGEPYFFSLNFNLAGQALPPADPATVATTFPRETWGIILFDSLVMNHDRHESNIAHDAVTNRLQIFDHSHAFLHAGISDISATLKSHDGQLCIGNHCLAKEISDFDGLSMWGDRIKQIPDFFIEGVIASAVEVGLAPEKKKECIDFMIKRRHEVVDIISANLNNFPKLPKVTS